MLRWKLLLALFALLTLACAPAIRPAGPGGELQLAEGEGFLILHVDTDVPLAGIHLSRGAAAKSVAKGHHVWIVRAAAGSHRFTSVGFGSGAGRRETLHLKNEEEFRFEVKAGSINYPGALIVRSSDTARANGDVRVRNRNHSAMAVRMLRTRHAKLLDQYPLRYAGLSGDGFLEHFTQERRVSVETP